MCVCVCVCVCVCFNFVLIYNNHKNTFSFGSGSRSQEIWLDNLFCYSFDSRLVDCSLNTIGDNNCDHFQDVMISCINSIPDPTFATDSDAGELTSLPVSS